MCSKIIIVIYRSLSAWLGRALGAAEVGVGLVCLGLVFWKLLRTKCSKSFSICYCLLSSRNPVPHQPEFFLLLLFYSFSLFS